MKYSPLLATKPSCGRRYLWPPWPLFWLPVRLSSLRVSRCFLSPPLSSRCHWSKSPFFLSSVMAASFPKGGQRQRRRAVAGGPPTERSADVPVLAAQSVGVTTMGKGLILWLL